MLFKFCTIEDESINRTIINYTSIVYLIFSFWQMQIFLIRRKNQNSIKVLLNLN
jgi:hypothetical protein